MGIRRNNNSYLKKIFEFSFIRSWWVVLFLLICYVTYGISIKKRNKAIFDIKCKHNNLLKEKHILLTQKDDLQLRLQSQSDPSWIELVLMKELGVVPENKIKVHFKK
jgi:hypothetical protein